MSVFTEEEIVEQMKSMMLSCYAYKWLHKENHYLARFKEELGEEKFNEVYNDYEKHLTKKYAVKVGVYTDGEGCTYNELVEK